MCWVIYCEFEFYRSTHRSILRDQNTLEQHYFRALLKPAKHLLVTQRITLGCISAGAEPQEEEKEEKISQLRNRECIYNYIQSSIHKASSKNRRKPSTPCAF